MGLFDLFKRQDEGTKESRKIGRLVARILNEHHQIQVRQESLEELRRVGTPKAIAGLVQRLGVNFKDTIKNEQEKRWVDETLVKHFAEHAINPLTEYIRNEAHISGPIRALAKLIDEEKLVTLLMVVLGSYEPKDHRSIQTKLQLIDALTDLSDERVVLTVMPYAMDHDDDVRIKVMELLQERIEPGHEHFDAVSAQLIEVIKDSEASARLTRRAAEVLIKLDADLSSFRSDLEDDLPDGYAFNAKGRLAQQ